MKLGAFFSLVSAATLGCMAAAPRPAYAASYTFTNIADDTGKLGGFGAPAINAAGTVAFYARVASGSAGIFSASGGAITRIARETSGFRLHPIISINAKGRVAFYATFDGGSGVFSGRGGPVKVVALSTGLTFASFGTRPVINDADQLCFRATLDNGDRGVFISERGGALSTVVLRSNSEFDRFRPAVINGTGTVTFEADLDSGRRGIFTSRDGQFTTIAEGTFFRGVAINDAGTIAFHRSPEPGSIVSEIYRATAGTLTKVASAGEPEGAFRGFGSAVSINEAGTIAFEAFGNFFSGIFTGHDPEADKVIRSGDPLFGSTPRFMVMEGEALNDAGQIAFHYFLEDGRHGIAVATPVP